MRVKLRQINEEIDDIIEKILRIRGVPKKDVAKFLFPDESMKPDYRLLDNIEEGIDLLNDRLKNKCEIMIIVD